MTYQKDIDYTDQDLHISEQSHHFFLQAFNEVMGLNGYEGEELK